MIETLPPESAPAPAAVPFLGVEFSALSTSQALAAIIAQANRMAPFAYVATPNADHVTRLAREPRLAPLYRDAWLRLNDSRVLELLAAQSGITLPAVPGSDLTARILSEVINPHEPVVVIGGSENLMFRLQARLGLKDLRWRAQPMGLADNPVAIGRAAAFMAANPARFTFIAVGSPQQEMVARAALQRGDCRGVGLCIGASLEFAVGLKARAPDWMQTARLEWAHRLASEPGRLWKRYLLGAPELVKLWLKWRASRAS